MDYIKIADTKLATLLAITSEEQEKGLKGQSWPPPVMSFVYGSPRVNKFWMHSTPSPLDIVFCYQSKIISIFDGKPYSTKIIGNDELSDLVVEFPAGTCNAYGVKIGDPIKLECSENTLMKIFMLKNGF